jgi:type I restriction enzyme, R subunit
MLTRTISEIIENIWHNRDRDYNVRCLVKRLQRIDKEMSGEARQQFANFLPEGDVAAFATALPKALRQDFAGTLKLLRDSNFLDLLISYQRKPRHFYVSEGTQDTVSSEWLVRGADGQEYKPADYLKAFAEFVRIHETDIDAIAVILKTPHRWNPDALQQLRQKLATAPQRFTTDYLQKAHEIEHKKALVDIISMVKHAADDHNPLLTATERVEQAFRKITAGRTFSSEQQQWLDRIRTHLRENLSIDQEDFESQPVFTHYGGWGRASSVFAGQLPDLIQQLNLAIAA